MSERPPRTEALHRRHGVGAVDTSLAQLRRDLCDASHELHRRGWVANHDGNASLRLAAGRFLMTPTAMSKRLIGEHDLIVVDGGGKVVQGARKPFSEWALHKAIFAIRPDVQAVIHAHPPAATALAVAGIEVEPKILAEAIVSLGDRIPMLRYALPGAASQEAALREAAAAFDVVTLEHHGVLTCGDDVETALLRLELVEHLAEIALRALPLGKLRTLPEVDVAELLQRRTRAGLGPAARVGKARPAG